MKTLQTILEIILILLAVDFLSGVLHWLEDSYGNPDWPIIGRWVIEPNMLHHESPTAFTKNTWLQSSVASVGLGGMTMLVAALTGLLTWQLLLFITLGVNANEIHKWSHLPNRKRSRLVTGLQKSRLIQTPAHHARHHAALKNTNYCVVTNFVNPVLERLRFWRVMESAIEVIFGISKRGDPTVSKYAQRMLTETRRDSALHRNWEETFPIRSDGARTS